MKLYPLKIQENELVEKKNDFWKYTEEECDRAKREGSGFLLQGDLNLILPLVFKYQQF